MANKTYTTGLIITGNSAGGVKAIKATREQLEQLNASQKSGAKYSKDFGAAASNSFMGISKTALGAVAGIAGVTIGIKSIVDGFTYALNVGEKYERQQLRTEALIKATAGAAGLSSKALGKLADGVALNTLQSVEGVSKAINIMQTFKSVTGETFKQSIALSADLATVMGGDITGSALQLGKALEDPVKGITALSRSGVSFTESQKELIKKLVETGEKAEAQRLILAELEKQVGGVGSAESKGLSGSYDTLSQKVDEFALALNRASGAGALWKDIVDQIARGMGVATAAINADFVDIDPTADFFEKALGLQIKIQALEEAGTNRSLAQANRLRQERIKILELLGDEVAASNERAKLAEAEHRTLVKRKKEMEAVAVTVKELTAEEKARKKELESNIASNKSLVETLQFENEALKLSDKERYIQINLRKLNADATAEEVEQVRKLSGSLFDQRAAAKGAGDASEEYIKSWRTAGDRVASTLQNSIASGDWSGLGKTVGGIFAGSIAGLVTDSLMETLGSDAFGAALGPVIGGVAGGVAALAISKLSDYLSGTDLDPTAQRQAAQGVGSVLGSIDAKSESIAKATDLTANAASELVNINRSMLSALQALNVGISGVVSQTARAAGGTSFTAPKIDANLFDKNLLGKGIETQFDVIGSLFSLGIVNNLGELIGKALGGKSKKVDEGIRILGGDIQSLVEGSVVDAFASFKVKKNIFDDYDLKEQFASLGDEVNSQFGLVFGGIIDSVAAGAEALGLSSGEISERLNSVILETQTISLEGLDAAAQQAEIQAVFSKVFDDTVTAVVPYLDEMQRAGEGLGETLARVSTEFELAKEAYLTLGFQIGETLGDINPALASMGRLSATIAKLPIPTELMVQAADDLIGKVGGLEAFSSALTGFERNFLSAEEQTTNLSRRLGEALGDLPLPETREGFKDLLQAQDAMTEGGRENIATLLKVQGAADQYYDMLEDAAASVVEVADTIEDAIKSVGDTAETVADVVQITADQAKSALQQMHGLASSNSDSALQRLRDSVGLKKDDLTATYNDNVASKRASYSAQIDRIKANSDEYIKGLQEAEDVRLDANQIALDAARDGLQSITSEVGSLSSALEGLREASLPSEMLRGQALSTLHRALSTGNLSGVGDAAGIAAKIDANSYSSATDFAREQGVTRNLLEQLERSGLSQESTAEMTISRLEDQIASIKEASEQEIETAREVADQWLQSAASQHETDLKNLQEKHEAELKEWDLVIETAEDQLELLRGIDSSIGDVATELGRFATALENELAWQNRNQLDSAAMLAGIAAWAPELKAAGIDVPGFASGGTFSGGLRLVGERGPELEVTGPSRIFSNNETRSIFDSSSIVAELKKLGARLEMLEQYTRQTTKNTGESVKYTKRWDVDGLPPERAA